MAGTEFEKEYKEIYKGYGIRTESIPGDSRYLTIGTDINTGQRFKCICTIEFAKKYIDSLQKTKNENKNK